jgi:hypothetical protein
MRKINQALRRQIPNFADNDISILAIREVNVIDILQVGILDNETLIELRNEGFTLTFYSYVQQISEKLLSITHLIRA